MPSTTVTANLSKRAANKRLNGRDYLVVPASLISPGVLNGSKGPLFYPKNEIEKDYDQWNNVPITLGHPATEDGTPTSARHPGVLNRVGLGYLFNTEANGKLKAEAWIDVKRAENIAPDLLSRLRKNEKVEVSTGLFTDNVAQKGSYKGRDYTHVARNYRPDHLAILMQTRGACSVQDGCGLLVNEESRDEVKALLRETMLIANANCGIGKGGFQPGNDCAKGGKGLRGTGTKGTSDRLKDSMSKFESSRNSPPKMPKGVSSVARKATSKAVSAGKSADSMSGNRGGEAQRRHVSASGLHKAAAKLHKENYTGGGVAAWHIARAEHHFRKAKSLTKKKKR